MAEAKDAKVTVRNNTVTFDGKDKMKAMRISFMPNGMVRVTETGAAGAGGTGVGTADRPGGTGTGTTDRPGATGSQADSKMGVYVLTGDYFAICLHDDNRGTGGAGGTGTGGTGTGTGGATGGAGSGTGSNATGATGSGPTSKTYCNVILRRSGAAGGAGTGTDRR